MWEVLTIILLLAVIAPFVVYFMVKLGVVAYHRGKHIAQRMNEEDRNSKGG